MQHGEKVQRPVYQLIALDVAQNIAEGRYRPDEKVRGRSTLAGKYNVSPETVRRAMSMLQDMEILEMRQGSGIYIRDVAKAARFVEKFRAADATEELKRHVDELTRQRAELDARLGEAMDALMDSYRRFAEAPPLVPFELKVEEGMALTGRNLADVNFWHNTGATIVAIRREGKMILSPGPYAEFLPGDVFLLVCDQESFRRAANYVSNGR